MRIDRLPQRASLAIAYSHAIDDREWIASAGSNAAVA
jgi:hypothetical protein